MTRTLLYVAKCPETGRHLREATEAERRAYNAQDAKPPFDRPVKVGEVIVDTHTGPGGWHGGGRVLMGSMRPLRHHADDRSSPAFWERAERRSADINETFLEIQNGPNPLTRDELERLIEKRPEVWGRFEPYLARMGAEQDD